LSSFQDRQYVNDGKDAFDPVVDNQPLCQIHQTLNKSTLLGHQSTEELSRLRYNINNPTLESKARNNYLTSRDGSQKASDIFSDLPIPQRPVLGQYGNWHSNHSSPTHKMPETGYENHPLVNSYSQGNIYAVVDPDYEVDSGYTESSDLTCERKEDSLYNSSSSNSNTGYYQDYRTGKGFHRPENLGSVKPSTKSGYNQSHTTNRIHGKPKVFSISKTLHHGKILYSSDESEDKPVSGLSLQKARDRNMRKTKTDLPFTGEDIVLSHHSKQGSEITRLSKPDRYAGSPKICQIHNYYSSCEQL